MKSNEWVPLVLKDIEKYCYENDLLAVAYCLEDARRHFKMLHDEETSAPDCANKCVVSLRLVSSKPF